MRAAARALRVLLLAVGCLAATTAPAFAQLYGWIDTPAQNGTASEPFTISGWAFYADAATGSGIDAIDVWATSNTHTTSWAYWGAATIGQARPDVAAAYNNSHGANSGYSLLVSGLAPDTYYVQVWTRNAVTGVWAPFTVVFTVTATPVNAYQWPSNFQAVTQPFTVSGFAFDPKAPTGTGVDSVQVQAYPNPGSGQTLTTLGTATYGDARSDVSAAYGARYLNSGYHYAVSGLAANPYMFVVSSHNVTDNTWTAQTGWAYVNIPTVGLTINRSGTGTGGLSASTLSCPGGSSTQAMPCGATYPLGSVVTLTALPDTGSTFAGWGGGCASQGTNPTCTVTLNGDRYAFVTFNKIPSSVATTYYHTDVIGSVRAITDQSGAVVVRHDYYPFGEDTQPLSGDPMRFGGKELDPESALMNFEARYYRNTWGRFTQVDPIGGNLGDTQSWNRYAYARNNPLRFVDPNGMETKHACETSSSPYSMCFGPLPLDTTPFQLPTLQGGGLRQLGNTVACNISYDADGLVYLWQFCPQDPGGATQFGDELDKSPTPSCPATGCGGNSTDTHQGEGRGNGNGGGSGNDDRVQQKKAVAQDDRPWWQQVISPCQGRGWTSSPEASPEQGGSALHGMSSILHGGEAAEAGHLLITSAFEAAGYLEGAGAAGYFLTTAALAPAVLGGIALGGAAAVLLVEGAHQLVEAGCRK